MLADHPVTQSPNHDDVTQAVLHSVVSGGMRDTSIFAPRRTTAVDGVAWSYARTGEGPRVVLLHGWGASIESWGNVPNAVLAQTYEVLALDFPGFGQSSLPPQDWGVPEYAQALYKLLQKLDYLPCSIIAHSFGGRVSLILAAEHPEAVSRMVLTAAAGMRDETLHLATVKFVSKIGKSIMQLPGLNRLYEHTRRVLYRSLAQEDYLNAGYLQPVYGKVVSQDLEPYAQRVTAPTLLIWGDKDRDTPIGQAHHMHKAIKGSELVIFEGAGHFAYLEHLLRFCHLTTTFLRGTAE